jgi:uncharacterized protein (TIGR03435 family)
MKVLSALRATALTILAQEFGVASVKRIPAEARTQSPVSEAQIKRMLQDLLKARLGLAIHTEKRPLPVYALVIAKGGPKFAQFPFEGEFTQTRNGPFAIRYEHITMDRFAFIPGPPAVSRNVVNETGLAGDYDFTLDILALINDPAITAGDPRGAIDTKPAYLQALPRQLGLKLEPKTALTDVLVIDHVEKEPTGN